MRIFYIKIHTCKFSLDLIKPSIISFRNSTNFDHVVKFDSKIRHYIISQSVSEVTRYCADLTKSELQTILEVLKGT